MLKLKSLAVLGVLVGIVLAVPYMLGQYKAANYASGQVKLPASPSPIPEETSLSVSPEGKESITVNKTETENSRSYSFKATTGLIFEKSVTKSDTISIPLNTWSPDNKYLFLKAEESGHINYLVFSSAGKNFEENGLYLNVSELFAQKITDFKLGEVTGWASPSLLVVNSLTNDNQKGPSFWFDLTTKGFIRLSSRFD